MIDDEIEGNFDEVRQIKCFKLRQFCCKRGWSTCSLSRVMFSIGIIKKYCPTLGKWENIFISIAGCQTHGNIIRNVMETSVVLYLELGLPRQTCTLKS